MQSTIQLILCLFIGSMLLNGCGSNGGAYQIPTPIPAPPDVVLSSPALSNGRIFIGSPEGSLYAADLSGNEIWKFDTSAAVESSPAVSTDGSIYFGSNNGNIYSLYEVGDKVGSKWIYQTNGAVRSSPAIDHLGRIWIGSDDGHLYSIKSDGVLHFTTNTTSAIQSDPAIYGEAAVFVGNNKGILLSFDLDGQPRYKFSSGTAAITAGPVLDGKANAYYGTADGRMISVDKNGNFRWSFQTGGAIYSSPLLNADNQLFFGSDDHNIYALNYDGKEIWKFDSGAAVRSSPALFSQTDIIIGITDKSMLLLSTEGTPIRTFATHSAIHSSPLIVDLSGVYVGHYGKIIHKILATQINPNHTLVKASHLPWSKYRGTLTNPGRVECTTTEQILADFTKFGKSKWEEDAFKRLQSKDNEDFSGIYSATKKSSYRFEANLYSNATDNDSIALIAAASLDDNKELHTLNVVRSGVGKGNSEALGNSYWALVSIHVGSNGALIAQTTWFNGEETSFETAQDNWSVFTGGSTVNLNKTVEGISATASKMHTATIQPLDPNSEISLKWSESDYLSRFAGPTFFGFAAHSLPFASFRNINIDGTSSCALEP